MGLVSLLLHPCISSQTWKDSGQRRGTELERQEEVVALGLVSSAQTCPDCPFCVSHVREFISHRAGATLLFPCGPSPRHCPDTREQSVLRSLPLPGTDQLCWGLLYGSASPRRNQWLQALGVP